MHKILASPSLFVRVIAAVVVGLFLVTTRTGAQPAVSYEVAFVAERGDPRVRVQCVFTGLNTGAAFSIADFGEWTQVDSYYLRGFRAEPSLRRVGHEGGWELTATPTGWDGSLHVSYSIPCIEHGSRAFESHGLLPWVVLDESGAVAYAAVQLTNTLLRAEGMPAGATPTLTLRAPAEMPIVAGWSGDVASGAVLPLSEPQAVSGLVLFGRHRVARAVHDDQPREVYQFTRGDELAAEMLALSSDLVARYGQSTGRPMDDPLRVFIVDKGGGQWTPHGVFVQGASRDEFAGPHFRHLVAHELFHQWLGGYAKPADGSLVWFMEGFTEYQSLLDLVRGGRASREWFAERLLEHDDVARKSPALGKAFFGDAALGWRDGNGPLETLAYSGGAVLAFHIDAELHRRGKPRLARQLGNLAAPGSEAYTRERIRSLMDAACVGDLFAAYIEKPALPDTLASLQTAGFERIDDDVAYLGIEIDSEGPLGTIVSIDPDGPAAASGLRAGDVVTGLWPCRTDRPRLSPLGASATRFRFGLTLAEPGAEAVNVAAIREGVALDAVPIRPRRVAGWAYTVRASPTAISWSTFFGTQP